MSVQMSLDDEIVALLDAYAEAHTNNNRTRLVEDLVEFADEATAATGEDDPRKAIKELLDEYNGYEGDTDYDPHESHKLTTDNLEEMCVRDPVPPINPQHVIPPEVPQNTWVKAGVIAGMLRFKHDDPSVDDVEAKNEIGVKSLINRYCGGRSSVSADNVTYRLDNSIPEVDQIGVDIVSWMEVSEKYFNDQNEFMTTANPKTEVEFISDQCEKGGDVVQALHLDGDDRYEHAKKLKQMLDQRLTEIEMDALEQTTTADE